MNKNNKLFYLLKISGFMVLLLITACVYSQSIRSSAVLLQVSDAIGPATSDYIESGLTQAADKQAEIVIIQLDTPGGLDLAMRDIIRNILASPVAVAIYVSPSGARAASAGTYMLYASHIAAMAPATNLGAATPVQIGGIPDIELPKGSDPDQDEDAEAAPDDKTAVSDPMTNKIVNDAVAYIMGLAEMRGRNADWAEEAVRQASSLSSSQALEQNIIDVVATDLNDLLMQINGRTVLVNGEDKVLQTLDLEIEIIAPDWRNKLLSVITNPNIAYILMLLAVYGLFFELANPGFVLPGVIGAICLLLALYSLQVLPVNYAGLGLILLGMLFMTAETFVPSFGVLGIGGVIAFIVGSIILFDKAGGGFAISIPVIVSVALLSTGFFFIIVRSSVRAFRKPVVSGKEQLIGSIGEIMEDFESNGPIFVHGETWRAVSDTAMLKGDKAVITGINGLVLQIAPAKEEKE
jgi:membrane-bound serine protease (ClpP class)